MYAQTIYLRRKKKRDKKTLLLFQLHAHHRRTEQPFHFLHFRGYGAMTEVMLLTEKQTL